MREHSCVTPSVSRRQCVFCGRRPGSKEHVWPLWLGKVLPTVPASHRTEHIHSRGDQVWRVHPGAAVAKVSKRVCHDCNTGWMARLEERAKPILTPRIQGQGGLVEPHEQELIALWALKTIIAAGTAQGADAVPEEIARSLHVHQGLRLPDGVQAWLAGIGGTDVMLFYSAVRESMLSDWEFGPVDAFGATLGVGNLAIQVYGSVPPAPTAVRHLDWAPYLTPICPPANHSVRWPAAKVLTGEGEMDAFARSWIDKRYDMRRPT